MLDLEAIPSVLQLSKMGGKCLLALKDLCSSLITYSLGDQIRPLNVNRSLASWNNAEQSTKWLINSDFIKYHFLNKRMSYISGHMILKKNTLCTLHETAILNFLDDLGWPFQGP